MSRPRSDDPIIDGLLSIGRDIPDGDGWGWDWEVDPRARAARNEIDRLRAENAKLAELVEHIHAPNADDPCSLDHHGYCQSHYGGFCVIDAPGYRSGEWVDERPECWQVAADAVLAERKERDVPPPPPAPPAGRPPTGGAW